ncbi:MAG: hypothetical protein C4297_05975 [Gemmataceae bacterium]
MAQEFYSLEEAARRLDMSPQELAQKAQRREIRAFADRGTWRFRVQDIEELARQRGLGSDPGLQPADTGGQQVPDVFPFPLEPGGEALVHEAPKAPGSDSDVRLVPEGSGEVRLAPAESAGASARTAPDSDSDVKLVTEPGVPVVHSESQKPASDSDIRLEEAGSKRPESGVRLADSASPRASLEETELLAEVNLGEELAEAERSGLAGGPKADPRSGSSVIPGSSATEQMSGVAAGTSDASSDIFQVGSAIIPPGAGSDSDLDLEATAQIAPAPEQSGINLTPSSDAGISLEEEATEEIDLEQVGVKPGDTPQPSAKESQESSSEFELKLEDSSLQPGLQEEPRLADSDMDTESSDFELALDEAPTEEETGSEVVVVDEGAESLEETALVAEAGAAEEAEAAIEEEEPVISVAAEEEALAAAAAEGPPAEWGVLPTVFLVPTVLVMMTVGFLLFEMLRSVLYYDHAALSSGVVSDTILRYLK